MAYLSYEEAERYVLELPLHTKKNPFEATKAFYEWLGEPGSGCPIIHVAGTNGKGSVCAYLNSIFSTAGYRAGMFTSPHLVQIRERFVLENEQMEKQAFARLLGRLLDLLGEYAAEKKRELKKDRAAEKREAQSPEDCVDGFVYCPTFFETMFFVFMLWMEEEKPDAVLLETGMGGRLDVTNVIAHPAVTVITRIGLDHCEFLGDTTEKIAREKVCIFKEKVPAVCLETDGEVKRVFVEKAQKLSVPLVMVSKNEIGFSKLKKNYIDFFLKSAYDRVIEAHLETIAIYQVENAALAVRTVEQAGELFQISREQIEEGLSRMHWDARMEEVMPDVFLDGAHNPDGIRAFLRSVENDGFCGERWLLFGACADKQAREMVYMLRESGLFSRLTGTLIQNKRSLTGPELASLFSRTEESSLSLRTEKSGLPLRAEESSLPLRTEESDLPLQSEKGVLVSQPKEKADAAVCPPEDRRMPEPVFEDAASALAVLTRQKGEHVRIYIVGSLYLAGEIKRLLSA